jgi:hypothetical protein
MSLYGLRLIAGMLLLADLARLYAYFGYLDLSGFD